MLSLRGQAPEVQERFDQPQPICLAEVVLERNTMEENEITTGETTEEENNTAENSFNIEEFEKNLEDNSVSETELRYQNLIQKQDQLINNLRKEITSLKEKNLNLATSVSTIDTTKPQTTEDILAKNFLL